MTEPAFWDTSALVPLFVEQQTSTRARELIHQYSSVVWWAASVEAHSAFERLHRTRIITADQRSLAVRRLNGLRVGWSEIQPSDALRSEAERLLSRFSLKAADALQLAAAWTWSSGLAQGSPFICADARLVQAAVRLGFRATTLQ